MWKPYTYRYVQSLTQNRVSSYNSRVWALWRPSILQEPKGIKGKSLQLCHIVKWLQLVHIVKSLHVMSNHINQTQVHSVIWNDLFYIEKGRRQLTVTREMTIFFMWKTFLIYKNASGGKSGRKCHQSDPNPWCPFWNSASLVWNIVHTNWPQWRNYPHLSVFFFFFWSM